MLTIVHVYLRNALVLNFLKYMIYMHLYALQLNQYFLKFSKKKLIAVNKRTFQTQISCHIVIHRCTSIPFIYSV